jgi:hypothetical protein
VAVVVSAVAAVEAVQAPPHRALAVMAVTDTSESIAGEVLKS